jgi:hypothetical protein
VPKQQRRQGQHTYGSRAGSCFASRERNSWDEADARAVRGPGTGAWVSVARREWTRLPQRAPRGRPASTAPEVRSTARPPFAGVFRGRCCFVPDVPLRADRFYGTAPRAADGAVLRETVTYGELAALYRVPGGPRGRHLLRAVSSHRSCPCTGWSPQRDRQLGRPRGGVQAPAVGLKMSLSDDLRDELAQIAPRAPVLPRQLSALFHASGAWHLRGARSRAPGPPSSAVAAAPSPAPRSRRPLDPHVLAPGVRPRPGTSCTSTRTKACPPRCCEAGALPSGAPLFPPKRVVRRSCCRVRICAAPCSGRGSLSVPRPHLELRAAMPGCPSSSTLHPRGVALAGRSAEGTRSPMRRPSDRGRARLARRRGHHSPAGST